MSETAKSPRLFVALEVSDALRGAALDIATTLEALGPTLRWIRTSNLHVTLRFLGSTRPDRLPPVEALIEGAAREARPFELQFRGLELYPRGSRARVLLSPATAPPALTALVATLESGAVDLGFRAERRAYRPHLTLARVRRGAAVAPIRARLASEGDRVFGVLHASALVLLRSELRPAGAQYTLQKRVSFGESP